MMMMRPPEPESVKVKEETTEHNNNALLEGENAVMTFFLENGRCKVVI